MNESDGNLILCCQLPTRHQSTLNSQKQSAKTTSQYTCGTYILIETIICTNTMKAFAALLFLPLISAFLAPTQTKFHQQHHGSHSSLSASSFDVEVNMPPSGSNLMATVKIEPFLGVPSEIVEVRYAVPFALNVEPQKNLAICTKDGKGGEKVGDVLRYTSQWTLGPPQGDGVMATVGMFAGSVSWGCSLYNVMEAKSWEQVVEALVSNVESRTDEVVLLFERPLEAKS
jgi:hypothetical protein